MPKVKEIPEVVILEIQRHIHEYRDAMRVARIRVAGAKAVELAEADLYYKQDQLRDTATFLNEQCGTAGTDDDYLHLLEKQIVFTAKKEPTVRVINGAFVLSYSGKAIVRLCPNTAAKIAAKFGEWQYDTFG